ncbi:MAG: hypothetical protein AUJ49_09930 [Desulfovibrionaceae bacterium CG1_02_65_16]|nr:MAG: hypothetical protein AUJ49_09930 [Desulfovibrionaceae bacterium CG1_02_65_16]
MNDYFAKAAVTWDESPVRAAMSMAFYQQVLAEAPDLSGLRVLEFGCGTGSLGLRLGLDHGAHMIFLDASPAMFEVLTRRMAESGIKNASAYLGELSALPASAAPVDAVVSGMAMHHVADVPALFRAFRQLLSPGGHVLLSDLVTEDGGFHGDAPAEHNGFDPEQLAATLAACGFDVVAPRVFHILRRPDSSGQPHEYPIFFLAARAV